MKNLNCLYDAQKFKLEFLNLPFDRKIEIFKSHIKESQGLKHTELIHIVKKISKHFQDSIDRDLKNISDRQKLTYRNSPNISNRY